MQVMSIAHTWFDGRQFKVASTGRLHFLIVYPARERGVHMGTAVATYLRKWRSAGGNLHSYFADIGTYTKWGSWGALENVMNTSSPKYGALMSFSANNPCWWNGCAL